MKIYFQKNRFGFTLPELMIVMGIIAIMSGVMFVMLSGSTAEKKLEAAAKEVEATIKLAQNYALTGKSAAAIPGCSYTFYHESGVGLKKYGISGCSSYIFSLEEGLHFYDDGAPDDITFGIPHGQTPNPDDFLRVSIRLDGTTTARVVCVNSSGSTEILPNESSLCTVNN